MRRLFWLLPILLSALPVARAQDHARVLTKVIPLPVALDKDFQFRKAKLFSLGVVQEANAPVKGKKRKEIGGTGSSRANAAVAAASIGFETAYRNFGAVTSLDKRERAGDYFDFFWRARRRADITVRFEYRQSVLRAFVQARELDYPNARGSHKSEFAIVGDHYFDDGDIIAWRCLLIADGKIVAEKRSFLWK